MSHNPAALLLALLLLGSALWAIDCSFYFEGLASSDEMNYADVGRQIALGEGLTQRTFLPGFLRWYRGEQYQPYFVHGPGLPLLLAAVFKTHGVSDLTAILAAGYAYVLCGVALAFLVLDLTGLRSLATLSALLFYFNGWCTWFAISSMSEIPHALLVVLLFVAVRRGAGLFGGALAGAVWGLCYLLRQTSALLLPALAIFLCLEERRTGGRTFRQRLVWVAGFLLAATLSVTPEVARETRVFGVPGNPFLRSTFLIGTPAGDSGWIFLYGHAAGETSPLSYFAHHPQALVHKYLELARYSLRVVLPRLLSPEFFCLPVMGLLGIWSGALRSFKAAALAALGLMAIVSPLSFVAGAYFVYLIPLLSVLSADSILWGIRVLKRPGPVIRRVLALGVLLNLSAPLAFDAFSLLAHRHQRPADMKAIMAHREEIRQFFLDATEPNEVILTPLAVPASWTAGRRTLLYSSAYPPEDNEMWRGIESKLKIDAIVYTSLVPLPKGDSLLPGFRLVHRQSISGVRFRLYRRAPTQPADSLGSPGPSIGGAPGPVRRRVRVPR